MAASIEVLAIDQGGKCKCNTITQFLLVAQADLAGIVDLGAQGSIRVQLIFATQTEFGVVGAGGPRQLYTNVQNIGAFLEDGATEFLAIVTENQKKLNLYKLKKENKFNCHTITYTAVCKTKSFVV